MSRSKKIAYILCIVLFGCGVKSERIMLDHSTLYEVPEDYELLHVSQIESDYYQSLFAESGDNSLVLYKVLKGRDLKIYISIGYETNKDRLVTKILSNPKATLLANDLSGNNSFVISQKTESGVLVVHYLKVLDSGNKYLFTAVGNSNELLDQGFANHYFTDRIISK
jgi:hypothetical protein